ncbi:hypothetical protein GFO_1729 [Christiangramia forsetii KT0803]|uniref:Uncharacterized protein n=1 Tax=Christiangramia forsetii (strain DSM 17595 / CGMCC 1.15422 / KT0803) TaxID=411154 RepID=A0M254_CHRFK|nr:hypothetical protein GFO_1729 [Christiangramia forsetii KT0803]
MAPRSIQMFFYVTHMFYTENLRQSIAEINKLSYAKYSPEERLEYSL